MTEPRLPRVPSGPASGKSRFTDSLPAILVSAVLVGIVAGNAGWKGQGLIGKWVSPGLVGLLAGGLTGFALPLVLYGLIFLFGSWASGHRKTANFVGVVLWVLIFFPAWWSGGWYGVFTRLLRFLPLIAVLGSITWLMLWARKRYAPILHEVNPVQRPGQNATAT